MTCSEYLAGSSFNYSTFFVLAQGDLTAREFCRVTGIKSTHLVSVARSKEPPAPSLLTVRRLAAYTKVPARTLWLKVCNEFFDKREDLILHGE